MPSIIVGQTQKRINSTSRFFNAGGTTLSCKLKAPCSMQMPVFRVQGLTKGTLYNFCKFEGNYYWIDDVVYITDNIQELHCHLDPLATFRDAIKDTKGMVVYGSSTKWNAYIDDGRFHPEIFSNAAQAGEDMFGITPSTSGCIALTFTQTSSVSFLDGSGTVTDCGIHVALMDMDNFKNCMADLNNFNITGGINEIVQAFARAFSGGSMLDNILRVVWLPFDLTDVVAKLGISTTGYRYGLMLGGVLNNHCVWYEIDAAAIYEHSGLFTIDWNSLTSNLRMLRHDRFISLQICNAGGYMSIPVDCFMSEGDTLYYKCSFCLCDGSWSFKVCKDSQHQSTLCSNSGNCSVNLMGSVYMGPTVSNQVSGAIAKLEVGALAMGLGTITSSSYTTAAAAKAAKAEAADGASSEKGGFFTQLMNIGSGISGIVPNSGVSAQCTSGTFNGGSTGIFLNGSTPGEFYYRAECWKPLAIHQDATQYTQFCNEYGYPVNRYMRIGDNPGYVMCASANVSDIYGASEANKSTINSFLNNGIYIEE